jgi:uncharacterized membrane protein
MESLFTLLRIVSATGVLLLVPGYAFSLALFPRRMGLNFAQRLALAASLGLVITVVIGTLLVESGLGFRLSTYLPVLLFMTLVLAVVAWIRSKKDVADRPVSVGQMLRTFMPARKQMILLISITIIASFLTVILLSPSSKPLRFEQYTEFYVLDTAAEIPYYLTVPSDQTIVLEAGIINHEYTVATYQILVEIEGEILYSSPSISLAHTEQWEGELTVHMPSVSANQLLLLNVLLLKEGSTEPYRHLHLWIGDNP